jgi:hypothetical protein
MKMAFISICMATVISASVAAAEDFTGAKEVRLVQGDLSSTKAKTIVITDKAKIEKLVTTIKLEKKVPCTCDHIQHAVFVTDKGEITVSLCDHCFAVGKSVYVMSPEFYKLYTAYWQEAANKAKQPDVHLGTTTYPTVLGEVSVTLTADKPEIVLGEPVYLSFTVQNHSDTDLQTVQGGDYRNQFGRPESYSVMVVDANGQALPLLDAGPTEGGIMGPQKIPAKGTWVRRLFLPHWAKLTAVGDYTITCKTVLKLGRHTPGEWNYQEKTTDVTVEVATHLKIVPLDRKRMGELIETLGKAMLGSDTASAEATWSLASIEDERVIPPFNKAMETDSYGFKFAALDALAKFRSDEALRGLKKGMTTQSADLIAHCTTEEVARQSAANIRHAAAVALSKSPHPKAKGLLLSMWNDPYSGVRITVLHALGKMDTPESLALLTKMSQDSDNVVRDEALRYLRLRSKKP